MSTPPDERRDPSRTLRSIARSAAAILAVAAALCPPARASLGEVGEGAAQADGLYLNWIDRSVAPGKDFFAFANGGWIKSHPIPADRAYWGVDTLLEQQNQIFIRNLIESLAQENWPAGTPQRKIADFYASGMDERAIDAAGAAPLAPEFARIAAISSAAQLPQAFAHLQSIGVEAPLVDRADAGFRGQHTGDRGGEPERPRPAESRLLLEGRADLQGGTQPPMSRTSRACWCCSATPRPPPPPNRRP